MSDEQLNRLVSVMCIITIVPIGIFIMYNAKLLTILFLYMGNIPVYLILTKMVLEEFKKRKQKEEIIRYVE